MLYNQFIAGAITVAAVLGSGRAYQDPYEDILNDPNFVPEPEGRPNKTMDQAITEALGGLDIYMSDNFIDPSGEVTTELDMVLTSQQFNDMYMKDDEGRYKRKATRPTVFRWPRGEIPYEFVPGHFSANEVYYIKQAMQLWETKTCLRFFAKRSSDRNRIRFQGGSGCNSHLGMSNTGAQPINLQAPGCRYTGLYLHEVGHAIGLVHEHQLPDRDSYIHIIYNNVAPSMRIWFNKYKTSEVNQFGVPFEYSSVMHYGVTAFSKDGRSQTIQARDSSREHEIGKVYLKSLSFSDIKVVNLMYNCNKHCAKSTSCREPAYLDKNCQCVRPIGGGGGGGGATTPRPTTGCSNVWPDNKCDPWASSGECDNNPIWMKENCKKSCRVCTPTKATTTTRPGVTTRPTRPTTTTRATTTRRPSSCRNKYGDRQCQAWAGRNECDLNPVWMRDHCKKACAACSGTGGGGGGGGGGTTCVDNNGYCSAWSKSGYCDTNTFTQQNCKKSCNRCAQGMDARSMQQSKDGSSGARIIPQLATIILAFVISLSFRLS